MWEFKRKYEIRPFSSSFLSLHWFSLNAGDPYGIAATSLVSSFIASAAEWEIRLTHLSSKLTVVAKFVKLVGSRELLVVSQLLWKINSTHTVKLCKVFICIIQKARVFLFLLGFSESFEIKTPCLVNRQNRVVSMMWIFHVVTVIGIQVRCGRFEREHFLLFLTRRVVAELRRDARQH